MTDKNPPKSKNKPKTQYTGFIDWVATGFVRGWVHSSQQDDESIDFQILLEDEILFESTADMYREDLDKAGIGNGQHGYCFEHGLKSEALCGKQLQLCSGDGTLIGKKFTVPPVPKNTPKVLKMHSEHYVFIFYIDSPQKQNVTLQLFYDNSRFWQGTKALKVGENRLELPVCKEISDGMPYKISLGMLGNVEPLWVGKLKVSVNAIAERRYLTTKNKDNKPTICMIDRSTPKPDQDAGSYAALQEALLLQSLGYHIVFIPDDFVHSEKYTPIMQKHGVEVVFSPHFESSLDALSYHLLNLTAVYITRYHYVEKYIKTIKSYSSSLPILFNNADLHFLREIRQALLFNDESLMQKAKKTKERELDVMKQVDAILSYSEIEHAIIETHLLSKHRIFKCPWIVERPSKTKDFEQRSGVVFLGGYDHPANIHAVEFFIEQVMPLLRQKECETNVFIYGNSMPKSLYRFAKEDVIFKGYAESLEDVFLTHKVFIAPLFFGAGIKGKVLAAAACGIPCVLSNIAIEATGLVNNVSALTAESAQEWADQIAALITDEELWRFTTANQAINIEANYSFESAQRKMSSVFDALSLPISISDK